MNPFPLGRPRMPDCAMQAVVDVEMSVPRTRECAGAMEAVHWRDCLAVDLTSSLLLASSGTHA